jgi:glycosyltransferase involved in cell wall biosynthesis
VRDYILVLCGDPGVPWLGPSGASAHLRGVCEGFKELGFDVGLASQSRVDHRPSVSHSPGVHCLHLPAPKWPHQLREHYETWWARELVRQAVKQWGPPALIYERYSLFCDAGLRLQQKLSIPRIVELNAPLLQERSSIRSLKRATRLQHQLLIGADRIIAVSSWLKDWAVELGCSPNKIHHLPNGTRTPTTATTRDLKAELGDPEILIGFLGSMKPWHGIENIPPILDALPEAKACLIGSGPTTISHPNLHSLNFIDPTQLSSVLRALDVGIAPYSMQAPPWFSPLKLLDYRAHGLPIVASDVADCRLLLSEDDAVLPTIEPSVWATAIRHQAPRRPKPHLRSWSQVCHEAIEGMLIPPDTPPNN